MCLNDGINNGCNPLYTAACGWDDTTPVCMCNGPAAGNNQSWGGPTCDDQCTVRCAPPLCCCAGRVRMRIQVHQPLALMHAAMHFAALPCTSCAGAMHGQHLVRRKPPLPRILPDEHADGVWVQRVLLGGRSGHAACQQLSPRASALSPRFVVRHACGRAIHMFVSQPLAGTKHSMPFTGIHGPQERVRRGWDVVSKLQF